MLFRREQGKGSKGKVNFKLWGKIELNDDELEIVKRYGFAQAELVSVDQPGLKRKAILIGVVTTVVLSVLLLDMIDYAALAVSAVVGILAGQFWYDRNRETIYVKDLLHGRNFTCDSVIELARQEAWLGNVVAFFRQVMESAKHWDGTERQVVEPLPPEEARQVIIRGF